MAMISPMITDDTANVSRIKNSTVSLSAGRANDAADHEREHHPERGAGEQFQWECWARYAIE